MARWKLLQPHYMRVPGTFWEQVETTMTGDQMRKQYPVPKYLHPEDPKLWNDNKIFDQAGRVAGGDVVVCYAGKGKPTDIVFEGACTPDMKPLDEEAEEISAKLGVPMGFAEDAPESGYAGSILETLSQQMAQAMANAGSNSQSMDKLIETMNKMMEQNAVLIGALANKAVPATLRRP